MTGQHPARCSIPISTRGGLLAALLALALAVVARSAPVANDCAPAPPTGVLRPIAAPPAADPPRPLSNALVPAEPRSRPTSRPGDLAVPAVNIRVRVPAEAAPGQELTYRLTAENCSRASAHHVLVRVTLSGGAATFLRATPEPVDTGPVLVWKLGTMAPCARREITLVVQPTGPEDVSCCARVQFEHGQCVRTRIGKSAGPAPPAPGPAPPPPGPAPKGFPPATRGPSPAPKGRIDPVPTPAGPSPILQVRKLGPTEAARYDILQYKLEVRNVGRGIARNVVVTDLLPKGIAFMDSKPPTKGDKPLLSWNLGTLAPGETRSVEYQAVVDDKPGTLTTRYGVEATGTTPQNLTHTIKIAEPRLLVTKSGPKQRAVGRLATYLITVTNPSTVPITNVQLIDEVPLSDKDGQPTQLEFHSATSGGQHRDGKVRWELGTLAPGSRRTVQLNIRARRAGAFKNVCTVTADRGLTEQARVETLFEEVTGLLVEIDRDRDPVEVGSDVEISFRVRNMGKVAETNVDVVVTVPEGVKVIQVRGPSATQKTTDGIRMPMVPRLNPDEEKTVIFRVRGDKVGIHRWQVRVVTDRLGPDRAIRQEETLTVQPALAGATTSRKPTW